MAEVPLRKVLKQDPTITAEGFFVCNGCGELSPDEDRRGWGNKCSTCAVKTRMDWNAANPDRTRATNRRTTLRRKGLTLELYDAILRQQGGRCAICYTAEPGGRHGTWHVDHDHWCCPGKDVCCGRCVRCLLCHACNTNNFQDDPILLDRRAAQIRGFRARHPEIIEKHLARAVG